MEIRESKLLKPEIGSGMSYTCKVAYLLSLRKSNGFIFDPKDEYQGMESKDLLFIGRLGSARKYYTNRINRSECNVGMNETTVNTD